MSARVLPTLAVLDFAVASAAGWLLAWCAWPAPGEEARAPGAQAVSGGVLPAEDPFEIGPEVQSPQRPQPGRNLFEEIFPREGPARPPYVPARYDLGLKAPGEKVGGLADLRVRAAERQDRLEALWGEYKKEPPVGPARTRQIETAFLEYAFGEGPLERCLELARQSGPDHHLRLARFLLAECRFNEAVRELAALGEGPPEPGQRVSAADWALALLLAHQVQREELARHVPVVPPQCLLEAACRRRLRAAFHPGVRRAVSASSDAAPHDPAGRLAGEMLVLCALWASHGEFCQPG